MALLAKQWWRLIQNEGRLSYNVFKARYFPLGSPLHVRNSSHGSYVWQSLLAGKKVVDSYIWRVGDGSSIDLWRDRWLRNEPSYKVSWDSISVYASPTPSIRESLWQSLLEFQEFEN